MTGHLITSIPDQVLRLLSTMIAQCLNTTPQGFRLETSEADPESSIDAKSNPRTITVPIMVAVVILLMLVGLLVWRRYVHRRARTSALEREARLYKTADLEAQTHHDQETGLIRIRESHQPGSGAIELRSIERMSRATEGQSDGRTSGEQDDGPHRRTKEVADGVVGTTRSTSNETRPLPLETRHGLLVHRASIGEAMLSRSTHLLREIESRRRVSI